MRHKRLKHDKLSSQLAAISSIFNVGIKFDAKIHNVIPNADCGGKIIKYDCKNNHLHI